MYSVIIILLILYIDMIITKADGLKGTDRLECACDICKISFERILNNIRRARKKRGEDVDLCMSCAATASMSKKPQCNKGYYDSEEAKRKQSQAIKSSSKYYEGIKNRNQSGSLNGMFGNKHTEETKHKMSVSRTGKIGAKATAWRGGKTSLNKRVRGYLNRDIHWYKRVYERDNFQCATCGSKIKLDAHHIKPLSIIIKQLLKNTTLITDDEKYLFLISREEICDTSLENGITLCRNCHKEVHKDCKNAKQITI